MRAHSSLLAAALLLGGAARAAPPGDALRIGLPDSIYVTLSDPAGLDRDLDGLKDEHENRLADAWRPYFIFDENENLGEKCHGAVTGVETVIDTACVVAGCAAAAGFGCLIESVRTTVEEACKVTHDIVSPVCKDNVGDVSLQPFEPVVLFQVRPLDGSASWPRRILVKWGFLFRLDGGFRASVYCTNYHYGDTQGGTYHLISSDGVEWTLAELNLWSSGWEQAGSPRTSWTKPPLSSW